MRPQTPIITGYPIEWVGSYGGDISRTGTAKMRLNASSGNLEISVNGGAYAVITTPLVSAALANSVLAAPKLVAYQETILFSQFTDGGGASGTLNLSTSIPAGARYAFTLITAITGFTGDTSAVIIIGDGTDTDRYNTGTPSVFTTAAAGVDMGVASGTAWHTAAKTPVVTVTSAADFTAVVAGAATLTLFYYVAS
jgi:hypothetical protein